MVLKARRMKKYKQDKWEGALTWDKAGKQQLLEEVDARNMVLKPAYILELIATE